MENQTPTPLAQLRKLRDLRQQVDQLTADRNELIREALQDHSEREVATAAGLHPSRINQIRHEERGTS